MLDAIKRKLEKEDLASLVNSQWLIIDKIVRILIGIFLSAWMARVLGQGNFGLLNYAISFAALFFPLTELGLSSILVRELVDRPAEKTLLLGSSFCLKLIGGAFGLLVAVSCSVLINKGDPISSILILLVASSALFQSLDIIDYWFQSRLESKFVVLAKLGALVLSSLFKGYLLLFHPSLLLLALAILVESALNGAALVAMYSVMSGSIKQWRSSVKTARGLLGDSAPLILSGIMKALFLRIDQIMLLQMASPADLGLYAVAVRLAEGFFFLPTILYVSVFPNIVKAKNISEELFYRKLQKVYNIMAFMGYGLIVFFILFSKPIVRLLYGDAYSASAEMLMVLACSLLFINLGTGRGAFLLSMNWTKVHSLTMAGGCILNILLNFFLIPSMGGMGAAIASVAAYAFAGYFSCFLYPPLFRTGLMLTKSIFFPKVW